MYTCANVADSHLTQRPSHTFLSVQHDFGAERIKPLNRQDEQCVRLIQDSFESAISPIQQLQFGNTTNNRFSLSTILPWISPRDLTTIFLVVPFASLFWLGLFGLWFVSPHWAGRQGEERLWLGPMIRDNNSHLTLMKYYEASKCLNGRDFAQ